MHRACAEAGGGVPWDGPGERVVHLEGGGTVAVARKAAAVAGREPVRQRMVPRAGGESEQLARRDVA